MVAPRRSSWVSTRQLFSMLIGIVILFILFSIHLLDPFSTKYIPIHSIRGSKLNKNETRGIIICLFDAMIPMTISLVIELRSLGYNEIIQMYHCNGELSNISIDMLNEMDSNIEIIDGCYEMILNGKLKDSNGYRSFWLKPLALIHTRLDHVILMDADDLVFQNPSLLFNVNGYQETGTIFFYDREIQKKEYLNNYFDNRYNLHALIDTFNYNQYGLKRNPSGHLLSSLAWNGDAAHEQDSSIVVIHKSKAPLAMDILWQILENDRHRIGFTYGDKELFWLAYELAHQPYFFSPWANSGAEKPGNIQNHPDTLCGGLAQFMPIEENTILHINGGYIFNPYTNNDIKSMKNPIERMNHLLNEIPNFVSKRRIRSKSFNIPENEQDIYGYWPQECLVKRGSQELKSNEIKSIEKRIRNAIDIAIIQQTRLKIFQEEK